MRNEILSVITGLLETTDYFGASDADYSRNALGEKEKRKFERFSLGLPIPHSLRSQHNRLPLSVHYC